MTLRLCLAGNSHVGAYKRAWRQIGGEFGDVSIDMFGAPGRRFGDLDVRDGRLIAESPEAEASLVATGGSREIRLADYDALVVVGGSTRLNAIVNLAKTCCPPFMNAELVDRKDADRFRAFYQKNDAAVPVTQAFFQHLVRAESADCNAARLLAAMAQQSPIRLGHVATPFPSSALRSLKPNHVICQIADLGCGPAFAELAWKALEEVMPAGVVLVRPPVEVLVDGVLTDRSFSDGSTKLRDEKEEQGEDDFYHMNDRYGEIMLRRVLKAMRPNGPPTAH